MKCLSHDTNFRDGPLVGDGYWEGLLSWVREVLLPQGMISEKDLDTLKMAKTPEAVITIIQDSRSALEIPDRPGVR